MLESKVGGSSIWMPNSTAYIYVKVNIYPPKNRRTNSESEKLVK